MAVDGLEPVEVGEGTNGEAIREVEAGDFKSLAVSRATTRSFGEEVRAAGEGSTSAFEEFSCELVERVEGD